MSDILVSVENLSKDYKVLKRPPGLKNALKSLFRPVYETRHALDKVGFSLARGEILGYIGPNGAGKSTTIKIIAGILMPGSGSCSVFGVDPFRYRMENAKRIGIVFGQRTQLWWNLPAIESLELMRRIYRVPEKRYRENLEMYTSMLDMSGFLHTPVRNLSLGQRMRVDFCASLLHDPELLVLDEPTIGLDVVAKSRLRKFIREIVRERKTTVLLTTHDLSDIEKLCSRVLILDKGRLVYNGTLENLKQVHGTAEVLTLVTEDEATADIFSGIPVDRVIELNPGQYEVHYDRTKISPVDVIGRVNRSTRVIDFTLRTIEIEELICGLYESGNTPGQPTPPEKT